MEKLIEKSWYESVDGLGFKGEFIDIDVHARDRLYIRYSPIADSGVELERTRNQVVIWRVHVQPLGVSHSKYNHEVWTQIKNGKVQVNSFGAKQIAELRDLETGALISRNISDETPIA